MPKNTDYRDGASMMRETARRLALKLAEECDDRLDYGLARNILETCARKIGQLKLPKASR